ncbi:MAG TPA: hypothetical protein VLF91_03220 [Candidatus Saccharimonadales bacterium]|nr:hypothetical protein [Candidatus Saccharimonadales bacterium]
MSAMAEGLGRLESRLATEQELLPQYHLGHAAVSLASQDDLDGIVDLDLRMFHGAYGDTAPQPGEVYDMMKRRLTNVQDDGGWMYVTKVDGYVQGMMTGVRTDKPWDQFESWESSTNNGTLDDVADPHGKYVYIANLTIAPQGSEVRSRERMVARMIAQAIRHGIEYGYFVSRMPGFKSWVEQELDAGRIEEHANPDEVAQIYSDLKIERNGKLQARDYEIRMYDGMGAEKGMLVPDAFQDDESLNYGIVYRYKLGWISQAPRFIRSIAAAGVNLISRMPNSIIKKLI